MIKHHSTARGPAYILSALLLPAFALAACEAPEQEQDLDPQMEETGETQPPENDTIAFSSGLDEVGDSGVSGEVTMMRPRANGVVNVLVDLEELPREGEFQASLNRGSCEALTGGMFEDEPQQQEQQQQQQMGGEVAELNPVMALADGTGTSQTNLESTEVPMNEDLSVRIMDNGQQPVACADIGQDEWDEDGQTGQWNSA